MFSSPIYWVGHVIFFSPLFVIWWWYIHCSVCSALSGFPCRFCGELWPRVSSACLSPSVFWLSIHRRHLLFLKGDSYQVTNQARHEDPTSKIHTGTSKVLVSASFGGLGECVYFIWYQTSWIFLWSTNDQRTFRDAWPSGLTAVITVSFPCFFLCRYYESFRRTQLGFGWFSDPFHVCWTLLFPSVPS